MRRSVAGDVDRLSKSTKYDGSACRGRSGSRSRSAAPHHGDDRRPSPSKKCSSPTPNTMAIRSSVGSVGTSLPTLDLRQQPRRQAGVLAELHEPQLLLPSRSATADGLSRPPARPRGPPPGSGRSRRPDGRRSPVRSPPASPPHRAPDGPSAPTTRPRRSARWSARRSGAGGPLAGPPFRPAHSRPANRAPPRPDRRRSGCGAPSGTRGTRTGRGCSTRGRLRRGAARPRRRRGRRTGPPPRSAGLRSQRRPAPSPARAEARTSPRTRRRGEEQRRSGHPGRGARRGRLVETLEGRRAVHRRSPRTDDAPFAKLPARHRGVAARAGEPGSSGRDPWPTDVVHRNRPRPQRGQ